MRDGAQRSAPPASEADANRARARQVNSSTAQLQDRELAELRWNRRKLLRADSVALGLALGPEMAKAFNRLYSIDLSENEIGDEDKVD